MSKNRDIAAAPQSEAKQHAPLEGAPVDERQIGAHLSSIADEGARTRSSNRLFTVVLFAMVSFSLLFIMLLGANGYSALIGSRDDITRTRLLSTSIATDIRLNDQINSVGTMTGPEGEALTLSEHTQMGTYQTRLYLHEGWLVKEYSLASSPLSPQTADKIVKTSTFTFSMRDGLLTFATDEGENRVHLRSVQGNLPAKGGA